MNTEDYSPEWPNNAEDAETVDRKPAEQMEAQDQLATKSPRDYDDDVQYVSQMMTLVKLSKNYMCVMGVSDGYTDHTVNFCKLYPEDRQYVVVYSEVWPLERGTFLQKEKNAAGVCARLYDAKERLWAVTHTELFRVLVAVTYFPEESQ